LQCAAQGLRSLDSKSLQILVGNIYCPVPETHAKESRCGKYRKMHAWELVAKIVQDLNLISRLALLPKLNGGAEYGMSDNSESVFSSARHILEPLLTTKSEINPFHVSSTHQTSYGYFNAGIEIHMVDGTSKTLQHKLVFKAGGFRFAFRSPFRVSSSTERAVPVTPNV